MASCPVCRRYFDKKAAAVEHIQRTHPEELERTNMDASQLLYASTHNGDVHGRCMVCGKPTEWCEKTGKPFKLCADPSCRKMLKAQYDQNLMAARGITQSTLMSSMQHQQELLNHRRITDYYVFSDGGKVEYVGKLELNFLRFLDSVMELRSNQVLPSPESFTYHDPKTNKDRIYIPDYYLVDYNLLVEIKDGGDKRNTNPKFLEETRYKVALKDEAMRRQTKYNYIRIAGTNYGPFLEILYQIVHEQEPDERRRKNLVVINEAACTEPEVVTPTTETDISDIRFMVGYYPGANTVRWTAISDSPALDLWIVSDFETGVLLTENRDASRFRAAKYRMYRYISGDELMRGCIAYIRNQLYLPADDDKRSYHWELTDIFSLFRINFDDCHRFTNNDRHACDFIFVEGGSAIEGEEVTQWE